MPRIATYDKRRMTGNGIPRNRAIRPKTFKSEDAAKKYAEANSLKNYKLVDICVSPVKQKYKIVLL